ncbi:MAG: lytic transglycosylase domain-containing protein [Candidatus Muiribacteriota bacterium]
MKILKKFIILILIFIFSIPSFTLHRDYKILFEIDNNENYELKDISNLEKYYNKNSSIKWYSAYLLYKYYKNQNNFDKTWEYLNPLYRFSYIDDPEIADDYIEWCIKKGNINSAIKAINKHSSFYNEKLKKIIIDNKEAIIEVTGKDDFYNMLYKMGFYEYLIQNEDLPDNLYVKSKYGLRNHKKVTDFYAQNPQIEDREARYFISRSLATQGNYKMASDILKFAEDGRHQTYLYYYIFYSMLSGNCEPASEKFETMRNNYFKAKVVETVYEKFNDNNLFDMVKIYNDIKSENFISSKIYNRYGDVFNLSKPNNYENSVYSLILEKNIYKTERKINSLKNFFISHDGLIKKMALKRPYIIYNDIMLTNYDNPYERMVDYFRSELPYHGLRESYKLSGFLTYHFRYPLGYFDRVITASKKANVDPFLVWAVMREESAFNWIVSERGASGLMQIMPATREWLKNIFNYQDTDDEIYDNIFLGASYLKLLYDKYSKYENGLIYAIMAYNGGQGNVDRWIEKNKTIEDVVRNIPYFETERYLYKVMESYVEYIRIYENPEL